MTKLKRIILEDGKPPVFNGSWSIGEVLQMAQQLAGWVESLQVNVATEQNQEEEISDQLN